MIQRWDICGECLIKDVLIGPDDTLPLAKQFNEKGFYGDLSCIQNAGDRLC